MENTISLPGSETALLVVDVQRALFTRPNPIYEAYKVLAVIKALISRSQLYGVQVIYIQHANDSILKKGTDGWKLHPELSPGDQDVLIQKSHGDAFLETDLQSKLEARGIKNLIITGLVTQGCIRATSLGGLEHKYRVVLVKGGHSNYNKDAEKVIEQREQELVDAGVFLASPEKIDFS